MLNPLEFYNHFDNRLIDDYVLGNKRVESAILNLSHFIPKDSQDILDIGCGIGWSSHEFSKIFEKAYIEGIDLSPVLVEKASILFKKDNLSFKVFDVTKELPEKKYDVIIMIDVYEHISQDKRKDFHNSLKYLLKNNGRILLACPSKFHQTWLKNNNPEGLQPIDENVDFEVINGFAKDLYGEIIFFQYKMIWRNLDYFYAVIEINPKYGINRKFNNMPIQLENNKSRQLRVKNKFGILIDIPKKKANSNSTLIRVKNKIKKTLNLK